MNKFVSFVLTIENDIVTCALNHFGKKVLKLCIEYPFDGGNYGFCFFPSYAWVILGKNVFRQFI